MWLDQCAESLWYFSVCHKVSESWDWNLAKEIREVRWLKMDDDDKRLDKNLPFLLVCSKGQIWNGSRRECCSAAGTLRQRWSHREVSTSTWHASTISFKWQMNHNGGGERKLRDDLSWGMCHRLHFSWAGRRRWRRSSFGVKRRWWRWTTSCWRPYRNGWSCRWSSRHGR